MTTPLDFARSLATSEVLRDRAMAVAIVTRGTTDDDPATGRQGWPLNEHTVAGAARYLDLDPTPELVSLALTLAPKISDAMLNKGAAR